MGLELNAGGFRGGEFAFESTLREGGVECLCALLPLGRRELRIYTRVRDDVEYKAWPG
jgi:hypothetical protein